jgi:hypothetical protein
MNYQPFGFVDIKFCKPITVYVQFQNYENFIFSFFVKQVYSCYSEIELKSLLLKEGQALITRKNL